MSVLDQDAARARRQRAYELRQQGMTYPQIAAEMGISKEWASQSVYQFQRDQAKAERLRAKFGITRWPLQPGTEHATR